mmetsp:Transcript_3981/g.6213  ORF Transcript_3981/g.6213 Transcript_3981/m.6213 type:complete len:530 (+) Transcript_3981:49-1638(+)|eukprot:CAMPEP_0185035390 /NCGR_PEP_ID=MMETSP1103-20130426/26641_1 /TAXON_ID=36769 /ORGANISM="Paraphysomonas bandaiensis, Strain Caron Lab Isolate" /LENGTH=529 /DNA_ID=CAMNT_0027572437 /DNA_START=35 /DNA_END=1624 /DNA_ORIENTATION=+
MIKILGAEKETNQRADEKRSLPKVQNIAKAIINIARFTDIGGRLHEQSIHKSRLDVAAARAPRYAWQEVEPSSIRADTDKPSLHRKHSKDDIDIRTSSKKEKKHVSLKPLGNRSDAHGSQRNLQRMRSRSMDDILSPRSPRLQPLKSSPNASTKFFPIVDHIDSTDTETQSANESPTQQQGSSSISPTDVPPPVQGKRVTSAPLLFWRCHLNAQVCVFYHEHCDTFEVIPYDTKTGIEYNRIYTPAPKIFNILEEKIKQKTSSEEFESPVQRLRKIKLASDYILATINAQYKDTSKTGIEVIMRRFNAKTNEIENLDMERPIALDPARISEKRRKSCVNVDALTSGMNADLVGATTNVTDAQKFQHAAVEATGSAMRRLNEAAKYKTDTTVNPSQYSPVRWRWIWAIDKVITLNKINLAVGSMFGGMVGKVIESNKGRLAWDVKARRGFNLNPYLNNGAGLDLKSRRSNEIEKFQHISSFRPLRYETSINGACTASSNDFKKIAKIRHRATEKKKKGKDPKGRRHSCRV